MSKKSVIDLEMLRKEHAKEYSLSDSANKYECKTKHTKSFNENHAIHDVDINDDDKPE